MDDDDGFLGDPIGAPIGSPSALGEVDQCLEELITLLKDASVIGPLTERGVNASLALLAIDGIKAYLTGDKAQAADDLATVAEEIQGRLKFGALPPDA